MKATGKASESAVKFKKSWGALHSSFTKSKSPILLPICISEFNKMSIEELSDHCSVLIFQLRDIVKIEDGSMRLSVSKKDATAIKKAEERIGSYRNLIFAIKQKILDMDLPTAGGQLEFTHSYSMDDIPKHLKSYFSQINVAADGSCFYRAVSTSCTGTEEFLEEMKLFVLEWMVSNRKKIEKILKDEFAVTYEEYFNKALQYGEWAEDYHLAVLAAALGKPIYCYRHLKSHKLFKYGKKVEGFGHYPVITGVKRDPIVLQYVSAGYNGVSYQPNHYIPLLINSKAKYLLQRGQHFDKICRERN